jgi:hypothetical protein
MFPFVFLFELIVFPFKETLGSMPIVDVENVERLGFEESQIRIHRMCLLKAQAVHRWEQDIDHQRFCYQLPVFFRQHIDSLSPDVGHLLIVLTRVLRKGQCSVR